MLIGRLTRKIQCHPTVSAIRPPTSGPATLASPYIDEMAPMYLPRSRGSNSSATVMNTPDSTNPPPTPCTARIAVSASIEFDRAQPSEAPANTRIPSMNIFLCPTRAAMPPQSSVAIVQVRR